jgi:hypothetical protein
VATITIRTARAVIPARAELRPANGRDDPELDEKAAFNFPRANDRIIVQIEAPVVGGALEAPLPPGVDRGETIVIDIEGVDASGRSASAAGSIRIPDSLRRSVDLHPDVIEERVEPEH